MALHNTNITKKMAAGLHIATLGAIVVMSLAWTALLPLTPANAATQCPTGSVPATVTCDSCPDNYQYISQAIDDKNTHCIPINSNSAKLSDNPIFFYLRNILRFLTGGIGLAVAVGIIIGGYMYITARANAGQVEKAKVMIINSIIGLILYIFMFAILQFFVPGGVF